MALQSLANRRRAGEPVPELSDFAALNSENLPLEDEIEDLAAKLNSQAAAATEIVWVSLPRCYAVLLPGVLTALGDDACGRTLAAQLEDYRPGSNREMYVRRAKETIEEEGAVEFDDNAPISEGDPPDGAYVQGWCWVSADGVTRTDCDECGETRDKAEMLPRPGGTPDELVCTRCLTDMQLEAQEMTDGQQPDGAIGEAG